MAQRQIDLLKDMFGENPQLDTAGIILAGKHLRISRSTGLTDLALMSIYKPSQIREALQTTSFYSSELGTIRCPDLNTMLFLPTKQTFRVPNAKSRFFLQRAPGEYTLPILSQGKQYDISGQHDRGTLQVCLSFGGAESV